MWITGSSWSEAAHKISRTITTFGSPRYPKEVKGRDFSPCVPKKSQVWEASAAGSQFCDLSIWLPGAIASLCFPLAAVFPGARLGWDPVQEISQCNLPLTDPTTQQVRVPLRLPVFARFFHLFIENFCLEINPIRRTRGQIWKLCIWGNKSQRITLTAPSSGLVKGREHQSQPDHISGEKNDIANKRFEDN